MSRLKQPFLDRVERFAQRVADVAETLEKKKRSARVVDQLFGAGTSVGANTWEAAEALSDKDFAKTIGIALKECNETRFWIRFVVNRGWIPAKRLESLETEALELKRILGAMVHKVHSKIRSPKSVKKSTGRPV